MLVVPAGFIQLATFSATNVAILMRLTISARIAVAGLGGATITGQDGSADDEKVALVFRPGSGAIASFSAHDAALEGFTDGDPPAETILAGAGTPPLVAIAVYGSTPASRLQGAAKTFTPAEDGTVPDPAATANLIYVKYKIYNSAAANIGIDLPDVTGDNFLAGLYIQAAA